MKKVTRCCRFSFPLSLAVAAQSEHILTPRFSHPATLFYYLTDTTRGGSVGQEAIYVSTSVHRVDDHVGGRAGTICQTVSNNLGRTRPAGHLEWRNADTLAAASEVCEQAGADARRSRQDRG